VGEGSLPSAYITPATNLWKMGALHSSDTRRSEFESLHLNQTAYEDRTEAIHDYQCFVIDYTGRELSCPSDVMNAFNAIQNVLKRTVRTDFWYGVLETYLDKALLWTLRGPHKRRNLSLPLTKIEFKNLLFPSWTWAGWRGKVEYGSYFDVTGLR